MTYKTHDPTALIGQLHFLAILHIGKGAPAWQVAPFPIANDKTQKSEKNRIFYRRISIFPSKGNKYNRIYDALWNN